MGEPSSLSTLQNVWFQKKPSVLFRQAPNEAKTNVNEASTSTSVDEKSNVSDDESEWQDVCHSKKKSSSDSPEIPFNKTDKATLTEEQAEALRELRRKRRQKEKIAKRQRKEQEKLQEIINSSKSTKIQVVNHRLLSDLNEKKVLLKSSTFNPRETECFEDEFPSLNQKTIKTVKAIKQPCPDSGGSEWETEDEGATTLKGPVNADSLTRKDEVKSTPVPSAKTFASVLLTKPATTNVVDPPSTAEKPNVDLQSSLIIKKVKRKDPLTFDFANAMKKAAPPNRASGTTISLKSAKLKSGHESISSKIRGRRLLVPKKKRPTKLKRIILKDRQSRKELAKHNLQESKLSGPEPVSALLIEDLNVQSQPCDQKIENQSEAPLIEELEVQPQPCDQKIEKESEDTQIEQKKVKKKRRKKSKPLSNDNENQIVEPKSSNQISNTCDKNYTQTDSGELDMKEPPPSMPEMTPFEKVKKMIHSRKFRPYCDHILSPELNEYASKLLEDLVRFQDRQFEKNQIKAKAKRRYVAGLREIKKFLIVKKISALLLAPDIENIATDGGLNDTIDGLVDLCVANGVQYFFILNRRGLGRVCKRKVAVSAVGILNYQGSELNYNAMKELLPRLQHEYKLKFDAGLRSIGSMEEFHHKLPSAEVLQPPDNDNPVECASNNLDEVSQKIVNLLK